MDMLDCSVSGRNAHLLQSSQFRISETLDHPKDNSCECFAVLAKQKHIEEITSQTKQRDRNFMPHPELMLVQILNIFWPMSPVYQLLLRFVLWALKDENVWCTIITFDFTCNFFLCMHEVDVMFGVGPRAAQKKFLMH